MDSGYSNLNVAAKLGEHRSVFYNKLWYYYYLDYIVN